MPTYDFECESCAYYTEIKQGFNDPSTLKCPHCGQNSLVKVFINPPAISVRGEPTTIGHLAERNTQKMGNMKYKTRTEKTISVANKIAKRKLKEILIEKLTL